jgi:indolepyruvate ferredoxin oxidoreductase
VNNGDRIVYRHHTNPEFTVGPWHVRIRLDTRNWMLHIVRLCKWWRRLPGWKKREAEFRDWYISLLDRIDLTTEGGYERGVKVLRCPEQVSGYREVRYPKMEAARAAAEAELVVTTREKETETSAQSGDMRVASHV